MRPFLRRSIDRFVFIILRFVLRKYRKSIILTCGGKEDGGGAQVHACFSTMIFANDFGFRFAHTPFTSIEHRPTTCSSIGWLKKWNYLICKHPSVLYEMDAEVGFKSLELGSLADVLVKGLLTPSAQLILKIPHAHRYADLFPSRYYSIFGHPVNPWRPKCDFAPKIVVHLRRGDVQEFGANADRFTSSAYLLDCIINLVSKSANVIHSVAIFSTSWCPILSSRSNYPPNVKLEYSMEECVFSVIESMAQSDVLLMAKSSLSYVGALQCAGEVYYQDFWHAPLPHWKKLSSLSSKGARFRK